MAYRSRKSARRTTRRSASRNRTTRRSRATAGRRKSPVQTVKIVVESSGGSMPENISMGRQPVSASTLQTAKKSRF